MGESMTELNKAGKELVEAVRHIAGEQTAKDVEKDLKNIKETTGQDALRGDKHA
jgi:hypothetical protein